MVVAEWLQFALSMVRTRARSRIRTHCSPRANGASAAVKRSAGWPEGVTNEYSAILENFVGCNPKQGPVLRVSWPSMRR